MTETSFEDFKKRVDKVMSPYLGGLSVDDMVDADWWSMYESIDEDITDAELLIEAADTLEVTDDMFSSMRDELGIPRYE